MTYDCILFNNHTQDHSKVRGFGAHRISSVLREQGYTCLVVDFVEYVTVQDYINIIDRAVGDNTVFIGFSTMWFPDPALQVTSWRNDDEDHLDFSDLDDWNHSFTYMTEQRERLPKSTVGRMLFDNTHDFFFQVAKKKKPDIKILFGGPISKVHVKLPKFELVDNFFAGYSETQIVDYMKAPDSFDRLVDHDPRAISGAHGFDFKKNKTTYEDDSFITQNEVLSLELARGCKFKCKFCSFPLVGMKEAASYIKDPIVFRDELLENYERFGVTKYSIMDDTFNDDSWKLEQYLNVIRDLPFKFAFWCYLRGDLLVTKPEQVDMLGEMGLQQAHFGFESFNPETARCIGKGMHHERIKEMAYDVKERWKANNPYLQATWILGLPFETTESFEKNTMEWILKEDNPIDLPIINAYQLLPKTEENSMIYRSVFDNTYEQWGYSFPELNMPDGRKWFWRKNDDTDINSFDDAVDILNSYKADLDHCQNRRHKMTIYETAVDWEGYDDFQSLKKMDTDQTKAWCQQNMPMNRELLFNRSIRGSYVDKLLKSL